jgi:hypothetical protein
MFVYYPKREALVVLFQVGENFRHNAQAALQFILAHKDHLMGVPLQQTNKLLPKMEVKHLIFEATTFAEQPEGATDWHQRILGGQDREIVDAFSEVTPVENPYYYASGMTVYWQVDLVEPFTIVRDRNEVEIVVEENPELEQYLQTTLQHFDKGFHDGRHHHGFEKELRKNGQHRAYKFWVTVDKVKEKFYTENHSFYATEEVMKAQQAILEKCSTILNDLKKFPGIQVYMNMYNTFAQFMVIVGNLNIKKNTYCTIENGVEVEKELDI